MKSINDNNNNNNNQKAHVKASGANIVNSRYVKIESVERAIASRVIKPDHEPNKLLSFMCTWLYAHLTLATFITFFSMIYLLFTRYFYITVLYYAWVIYDRKTCNQGGRRIESVYRSSFWKHLADYFPITVNYGDDFKLNPNKNYIVVSHPHGISAFGILTTIATNGMQFLRRFPGMRFAFMVHETSFMLPILREVFLARGDCSVNSRSFDYILSGKTGCQGNVICVIAGGLDEATLSDAEILKVKIANRKGFCRKALMHGASIIPSISFGENSVFRLAQYGPNSWLGRVENGFYKIFGFKHPIYHGQCTFSSKLMGLMPYKRPITVAFGNPINVDKCDNPTQLQVDRLHNQYIEQLFQLYRSNSQLCSEYDKQMIIV